ncbi:MAG: LD-carboxypeptidase [Prevotellaceae bacterium]|jgi:muramoyltetrapeptide carboxypeptidase|nr:LD-carboxypeptidase [Prevotellaceae bacterium]
MLRPLYLKENDAIALVAPAGKIDAGVIDNAVAQIRHWGFRAKVGDHATASYAGFAGTDEQRRSDLQAAIDDPDTAAILCARGGYGCSRIIDTIDFSPLLTSPKWLVGFSDITVLHARLQRIGLQSIHGAMPKTFPPAPGDDDSLRSLHEALTGALTGYSIPPQPLNHAGKARGILRGGNLSLLVNLAATPDDIVPNNTILFMEDTDEHTYALDRMMTNLHRSGKLRRVAGVVAGQFTMIKRDAIMPRQKDTCTLLSHYLKRLDVPVCYGFPAGHGEPNLSLYLGREAVLEVPDKDTANSPAQLYYV